MSESEPFYVFDLDGTLADCEHRVHLLDGTNEGWRRFYRFSEFDKPITPMIYLLKVLEGSGARVEIWSGRSDEVAEITCDWLREQDITCPIRMRRAGDHTPDVKLKRDWLKEAVEDGRTPTMVFEDRARVVEMWREAGVPCLQVAEGAF